MQRRQDELESRRRGKAPASPFPTSSKPAATTKQVVLSNILLGILDVLKSRHEVSFLFKKPVPKEEAPDYYDIIKEPMDLSTITDRVTTMIYKSHEEFRHDVCQIVFNAHRYNAGRYPHVPPLADQLLEICDYLLEENSSALADAEAAMQMDFSKCTL